MRTEAIVFCQRQANRCRLGETKGILEDQFCELDATLARLLDEAAQRRRSNRLPPAVLRERIEAMLGHWRIPRTIPKLLRRRLASSQGIWIEAIEWEMGGGIKADGCLLVPRTRMRIPTIIYAPDCSQSPEEIARSKGPAQRLVSRGFGVLVLRLISRSHSAGRFLNDRRHLHRLGWQLGRTFLGAEVATLRSAVGVLERLPDIDAGRIGVFGYDQGGQIALLAAALDDRIGATVVSNYFGAGARPEWQPVDRLLFGKANLFGEAELVRLIRPRTVCVELDPRGRWPKDADAAGELAREAIGFTRQIDFASAERLARSNRVKSVASAKPCSAKVIEFFESTLGQGAQPCAPTLRLQLGRDSMVQKEVARLNELETCFYRSLASARRRRIRRQASSRPKLAAYFGAIGRFPQRERSFRTRWKLAFDTHRFVGYETAISVYDGLHTYGVLLVPKGIRAGERRPAVVCQHGFQGQPFYTVGFHANDQSRAYNLLGAKLAERGYVVFCPYLCVPDSETRTRLVKKAWLLGGMPIGLETQKFSRAVDFLESLPFVDRHRIGYYGLSYGGYTALWFTPAEPRFQVVVCSGHFNDWQRKTTDPGFQLSCYLYHPDEDMYNFGLLERMDHVDLAMLCAPRPFAVEAGLRDGVFKIEWVRSEFRRVKKAYRKLGASERAQLFEFDGPHQVWGEETFPFLDRWLRHRPTGL